MNLADVNEEEKLLLRRLRDLSDIAAEKFVPRFSNFLNERQILIAEAFVQQKHIEGAMFFGGYTGAARMMCGFFPHYEEPAETAFPVVPVTFKFFGGKKLSHRDFLGSLMSVGIKRESVGDIIIKDNTCVIFLLDSVTEYVMQELKKVGGSGVKCEKGFTTDMLSEPEFKEITGTVSSARLDSLVKLATNLSREKSAAAIKSGLVQRNHSVTDSASCEFLAGDTVSVRGYGKFTVESIGNPTKKRRLPVIIKKYI